MGFTDAKKRVIACLNKGLFSYEIRGGIDVKNLLATGKVTPETIVDILKRCHGNDYSSRRHHQDSNIEVHIVNKRHQDIKWYIKWYFVESKAVFISVHH